MGTPVESVSVLFQRFGCFRKSVFCGVCRVFEPRELVSGSSARKGVEVQVLSSAQDLPNPMKLFALCTLSRVLVQEVSRQAIPLRSVG